MVRSAGLERGKTGTFDRGRKLKQVIVDGLIKNKN